MNSVFLTEVRIVVNILQQVQCKPWGCSVAPQLPDLPVYVITFSLKSLPVLSTPHLQLYILSVRVPKTVAAKLLI